MWCQKHMAILLQNCCKIVTKILNVELIQTCVNAIFEAIRKPLQEVQLP
jgi:hypothetical protein